MSKWFCPEVPDEGYVEAKNIYEAEKYLGCQREDSSCEFKNNCDGPIKYSAKKTNKK
jgi:hypothetical protein